MDYNYWHISFISCEGNERWTIARAPYNWSEYDVRNSIKMGGCGDDPATILSIEEWGRDDYSWDLD